MMTKKSSVTQDDVYSDENYDALHKNSRILVEYLAVNPSPTYKERQDQARALKYLSIFLPQTATQYIHQYTYQGVKWARHRDTNVSRSYCSTLPGVNLNGISCQLAINDQDVAERVNQFIWLIEKHTTGGANMANNYQILNFSERDTPKILHEEYKICTALDYAFDEAKKLIK